MERDWNGTHRNSVPCIAILKGRGRGDNTTRSTTIAYTNTHGAVTTLAFSQINYQYRNGTSFPVALRALYADGGIPRFYRGVLPALAQGPLSRFGDTAANTGILTMLNSLDATKDINIGFKTVAASTAAALFRIVIMPIDTVKTTMQVTGKFSNVVDKVKVNGPFALYNGSLAAASATFVGHYPYVLVIALSQRYHHNLVNYLLTPLSLFCRHQSQLVRHVQLFVGKDSETGYAIGRTRSPRHYGILLECHFRHLFQQHPCRQGLQTVPSRTTDLRESSKQRLAGVWGPGLVLSRIGNQNFGQRITGYPVFDFVEAF
jgi:hypothetical protein